MPVEALFQKYIQETIFNEDCLERVNPVVFSEAVVVSTASSAEVCTYILRVFILN